MLLDGNIILAFLAEAVLLGDNADQERAKNEELITDRHNRVMNGDDSQQERDHIKAVDQQVEAQRPAQRPGE